MAKRGLFEKRLAHWLMEERIVREDHQRRLRKWNKEPSMGTSLWSYLWSLVKIRVYLALFYLGLVMLGTLGLVILMALGALR